MPERRGRGYSGRSSRVRGGYSDRRRSSAPAPKPDGGSSFISTVTGELGDIVRGVPKAGYVLGRAAVSDLSPLNQAQRIARGQGPSTRLFHDVAAPAGRDYARKYGPLLPGGRPARETWEAIQETPVSTLLDVAGVASLGTGAAVKAGLLRGPGPRSLTYGKRTVRPTSSHNPLTGYTQHLYDKASEYLTSTGRDEGLFRLVSARRRVARQAARETKRDIQRAGAARAQDVRKVRDVGGKPETFFGIRKRPERTAFFWEAQVPGGLERVRSDLKRLAKDAEPETRQNLNRRIAEINAALKSKRQYDPAALDAARRLGEERESIFVEAGKLDPATAEARRGLLASRLNAEGDPIYVGHRSQRAARAAERLGAVRVGGGPAKTPTELTHENQLRLYETGRLRVDPDVIVEDWQRAQHYAFINRAKQELADMGQSIQGRPNPGWWIVNLDGHKLPRAWKDVDPEEAAVKAGRDPEELIFEDLDEYANNTFIPPTKFDDMLAAQGEAGRLVQVHPDAVFQFFARLVGPQGARAGLRATGETLDAANDAVRFAFIYANPGYIPANLAGNATFALLDQGPFVIPNLVVAAERMKTTAFRDRLLAEVGHGPSASLASTGRNPVSRGTRKVATAESRIADDYIRAAAWIHHARKAGFRSKQDQLRLLSDPKLRQELNEVRDRVNGAMVDFEAMGPTERAIVPRVIFVWPWIRGASKWPFRFVADHPVRAALVSTLAENAEEREELGLPENVKKRLRGGIPIGEPDGSLQRILNPTSFSPVSTPFGLVDSLTNEPLLNMANPLLGFGFDLASKSTDIEGHRFQQAPGRTAKDFFRYMPPVATGVEMYDPSRASRLYGPQTRAEVARRRLRLFPYQIDLNQARERG